MDCPKCRNPTCVTDSRQDDEGTRRRRRHVCARCNVRFTTYEIPAEEYERLQCVKVNMGAIRAAIQALRVVEGAVD